MAHSRRHAASPRGWRTAAMVAGAGALALTVTALTVSARMARLIVVPPTRRDEDVMTVAVDRTAGTVTFSRHIDSVASGRYGYLFDRDSGHAKIGEVLSQTPDTVTRRLLAEDLGRLRPALRGRMSAWFYLHPSELGLPFREVAVDTPLGPAPAWLVPVPGSTDWVIQVHGRAVDRREALRAVPTFHAAGYSSLLISYRNDGIGPDSADSRYALGATEWQDVEAAMRFAADQGATRIVLMGWSMGGAIVLQTVVRTSHPELIAGVVLESPVVDWDAVLTHQAETLRLPRLISRTALRMVGRSWGRLVTGQEAPIDLAALSFVRRAGELSKPILLLHSDGDTYVPAQASRALARLRPDIVTFRPFTTAGHTRLWNCRPDAWEAAITAWLLTRRTESD